MVDERTVVFNLRHSSDVIGGAEVVIRRTQALLDKERFKPIVTCLHRSGKDLSQIREIMEDTGCTYEELVAGRFFDYGLLRELIRRIKASQARILHCHDPQSDFYGWLLKRFLPGIKMVCTLHGWTRATRRGRLYKRLDLKFARSFHRLIAVSPLILEEAQANGLSQTRLIRNGVPVAEYRERARAAVSAPKPEGERWLGFVGRASKEKGPLDFIRVANLLKHQEGLRFVMAGDGPMLQEARDLAAQLNLTERFNFLGQVQLAQMPGIYASLDVLLSTSATEGLPNILLEAAAVGVPIVATEVGGVPEVVVHGETGFLAPFGAHQELADHVVRLLDDPALTQKMVQAGERRVVAQFSMEKTVAEVEALYQSLLVEKAP